MAENTLQLCTFQLGNALFGLDTILVQEIIKIPDITKVYQAPAEILGIINLRGKIVTIIDLAVKLELESGMEPENRRIIIVENQNEPFGLVVDQISDVIHIDPDELDTAPANVNTTQGRYITGVFRDEERLIAILNLEEITSNSEAKSE